MMNKQLLLLLVMFFGAAHLWAQSTVTGKVIDDQGEGLPGVNILVAGTQQGTVTDFDGNYTIEVPEGGALTYSFIGFLDQRLEVGTRSVLNVTLDPDVQQLSEVVVTALGIERDTRALQSSVTQIDGENFVKARENSLANALAGRVAGVNVTKIASGPASSSRVIIRGSKTLGSNLNQPLYVVDGVPMTNINNGQAGLWGGSDQGDGMSSLNPDDIESTTVLKGASAAALYGSRAANGVILITTKKGTNRKGIGIEFNSNYVFDKINDLRDLQQTNGYGGYDGDDLATQVPVKPVDPNDPTDLANAQGWWNRSGWGPRLDGSPVLQWDGVVREYSNAGDNFKRYYKTGSTWTNSLALTGGNAQQSFRFSVADLRSDGVVPNSGFDRFNLSLSTNSKFGDKVSLDATILYSNEEAKNRPRLSDSPGNGVLSLYYIPNDQNVNMFRGDPNKLGAVPSEQDQIDMGIIVRPGKSPGQEYSDSPNLWGQNPYWTAYQFENTDTRDRIITNARLRYDITDFLYVQGRAGMDWWTSRRTNLTPEGTYYQSGGSMQEIETRVRETNLEWLVGYHDEFGDISVNAFVGGNRQRASWEQISARGSGFNVPFFAAINNAEIRNFGFGISESGINSVFASAEVAWKNYLFVTATWRRDWFTQLDPSENSIDYPSVGASFVFTDAFGTMPDWLSFGKVRLSWGEVGNANSVGAYRTRLTYSLGDSHLGSPTAGFTSGANLPNRGLVPFTSSEVEVGFDVRFFNNRLGLDFTYYDQKTTDDIVNANISRASAFNSTTVNLGEITNNGIEVLLTGTPIRGEFTWDVSLNFAQNNSEVVALIEGQTELFVEETRTRFAGIFHVVGEPYGVIKGQIQKRSPDGQLVFDDLGSPVTTGDYEFIGNGVPDFTGGLNNDFSWKNFTLGVLVDFKSGGDIYSGTNLRLTQAGFTKESLIGRDGETPLMIDGVVETAPGVFEPVNRQLTGGEVPRFWGRTGENDQQHWIYDASFIKLRQIVLTYNIPRNWMDRTPLQSASLSFVARNLAIISSNVPNIDPESSYTSSNAQGLDYFGMPATRSYGFNLNIKF